jgi:hypothetical protein
VAVESHRACTPSRCDPFAVVGPPPGALLASKLGPSRAALAAAVLAPLARRVRGAHAARAETALRGGSRGKPMTPFVLRAEAALVAGVGVWVLAFYAARRRVRLDSAHSLRVYSKRRKSVCTPLAPAASQSLVVSLSRAQAECKIQIRSENPMPKHSLVLPYDQFHGGIKLPDRTTGLVLYGTARAGLVSRQLVVPSNPQSTQQIEARGFLSACSAAWKLLSAANAALWRALADQITQTNILGINYTLTGIACYCRVNVFRQLNGQAITATPPDFATIPIPITGITSCVFETGTMTLILTCTGMTNGQLIFARFTPSIASLSRLLRRNELRVATADSTDAFGTVAAGAATITFDPDLIVLASAQYCGIELTAMGSTYLSRAPLFFNHQLIAAA